MPAYQHPDSPPPGLLGDSSQAYPAELRNMPSGFLPPGSQCYYIHYQLVIAIIILWVLFIVTTLPPRSVPADGAVSSTIPEFQGL